MTLAIPSRARPLARLVLITALTLGAARAAVPRLEGDGARDRLRSAQGALARLPGETPMEKLAAAFQAGAIPTPTQLEGVWVGRSWWQEHPARPFPALALVRHEDDAQRGPLIPGQLLVGGLVQLWGEPDAFDTPEAIQETWGQLEATWRDHGGIYRPTSGSVLQPGPGYLGQDLRIFEGFLVLRFLREDALAGYAYFFLRWPEEEVRPPVRP